MVTGFRGFLVGMAAASFRCEKDKKKIALLGVFLFSLCANSFSALKDTCNYWVFGDK